jgi:hypothetical protein
MKRFIGIYTFFSLMILSTFAIAQDSKEYQAVSKIKLKSQYHRAIIELDEPVKFGEFKMLLEKMDATIEDIRFHFENGHVEDYRIRKNILPGRESDVYDMFYDESPIRRITIYYRTRPYGKTPVMELMVSGNNS